MLKKMLEYIHEVCKENNIRYYVAAGTLIGTIRHSGFIPWDDDIDIWMPYYSAKRISTIRYVTNLKT
ncbi:MAG: LicD family protein [Lachnospiraceae bacterium]|nr:LicD family protein [Lachnospiraceae bacterium]